MSGRTLLTGYDLYLFRQGKHYSLYEKLGAHPVEGGTYFSIWAPNAKEASVIGSFNDWKENSDCLFRRDDHSGIWEVFIPDVSPGDLYKYAIITASGEEIQRSDPMAMYWEKPPRSASVVCSLEYSWSDDEWIKNRGNLLPLDGPWSIYEVHLGSWMRRDGRSLSYRELAPLLTRYIQCLGFTAVEFLPVMEHPFYGSWGYQTLGYFAPTSRYGTPDDFMDMINYLHNHDIAVILDWVPSHFPSDGHGLSCFDGTCLYEHSDPRRGFHPQWKSCVFNYGRYEVRSFLISSALFWLERYHIDGLRVDGVASMLYLDYGRSEGEWVANRYGGRENLEAVTFLRDLNSEIKRRFPDAVTMAEESTDWPGVTASTHVGGLGFSMKWNMGWMHDTLYYMTRDPVHRSYHHNQLTFGIWYAFSENFILPLSHDEVVYGKGSLLNKMPGDNWQKRANLRLLLFLLYLHPGKKLFFMGGEFGQEKEWDHEAQLEWYLMDSPEHRGIFSLLSDLNRLYRELPSMHCDFDPRCFEWIDCSDSENSVVALIRKNAKAPPVIAVLNFTPVPRYYYKIGAPLGGIWVEICNSDSTLYGGSGMGNLGQVTACEGSYHGRPWNLTITLPPLAGVCFMPKEDDI